MHNAMVNGPRYDADKPPPQGDAGIGAHIGAAWQSLQISQQYKGKILGDGGPVGIKPLTFMSLKSLHNFLRGCYGLS
jgi:hypothetical protein